MNARQAAVHVLSVMTATVALVLMLDWVIGTNTHMVLSAACGAVAACITIILRSHTDG